MESMITGQSELQNVNVFYTEQNTWTRFYQEKRVNRNNFGP